MVDLPLLTPKLLHSTIQQSGAGNFTGGGTDGVGISLLLVALKAEELFGGRLPDKNLFSGLLGK